MDTLKAHGRLEIPGMSEVINAKLAKKLEEGRKLAPKAKNGITDPFSYYHILDGLLSATPGNFFTTRELMDLLKDRPIAWDAVTTGRIVNDIAESLELANGRQPVMGNRWWDGMRYWTSAEIEDRIAMENLLTDLRGLCQETERDSHSPLRRCASLV